MFPALYRRRPHQSITPTLFAEEAIKLPRLAAASDFNVTQMFSRRARAQNGA